MGYQASSSAGIAFMFASKHNVAGKIGLGIVLIADVSN